MRSFHSSVMGGFVGVLALAASLPASAQSAKNAVNISEMTLIPSVSVSSMAALQTKSSDWVTVLSSGLQMSQQKDIQVGVSLQCGLFTDTMVQSSGGAKSTSTAESTIDVQVLLDGNPITDPNSGPHGAVTFARRSQTLMAQLAGYIPAGSTSTTLSPEVIQLILDTMEANHFDWILSSVGAGYHTVTVQARVTVDANSTGGSATAAGSVGYGALTCEDIRVVKGSNVFSL